MSTTSTQSEDWMVSGEGHPKRWGILGVLVVSLLIVVLDSTVLNIALPTIQEDLEATQSQLVWSVDSYVLVFASLLFTWGVLGDRYGRRRVLVIGLVVFGAASLVSAFSATPEMLILSRAVMGVGGAAVMPTTLAIITVVFPPHERGRAIGAWAGAVGAAVALGPVLGGILLEHPEWSSWLTGNDWGAVFLINVPVVILGLIGVYWLVPETRNPHPAKLDIIGLILSFVGLVLVVYGIIHASAENAWLVAPVLAPILVGVAIIIAFLFYEAKSSHKSFDVGLFKNRGYAVAIAAVSLTFFAMQGIFFSLPFFFQTLRGMSTLQTGLAFLPFAVGQFLAAPSSGRLVERFGYRLVMGSGLVLVALALGIMGQIQIDTPLWLLLLIFFLFGSGMGLMIAPGTSLMQNVLPLARAGVGSAVQNTVRQVMGALGIAIMGTILGTYYATNILPVLEPLGSEFPTVIAEESVVATDKALTGVEAQTGQSLEVVRSSAYEVYLNGAHLTMWISGAVVVVAFLILVIGLPKIEPPRAGDRAPSDTWDEPEAVTQDAILAEQGLTSPDPADQEPDAPGESPPEPERPPDSA